MDTVNVLRFWALLCMAVCARLLFLHFVPDFYVSSSPAWQVAVFHVLTAALGLLLHGAVSYFLFLQISGSKRLALCLGVLVFAVVLALVWREGGFHLSFRDERVGNFAGLFGALSPLAVILLRPVLKRGCRDADAVRRRISDTENIGEN